MPKSKKTVAISGGVKTADEDNLYNDGNEPEKEEEEEEQEEIDEKSEVSESEEEIPEIEEEPVEVDKDEEVEGEEPSKFKTDDDGEEQDDETCLYNIKKKINSKILESDEFDDDLFEDEKIVQTKRIVKPEDRITKPVLTKYERVRLLSERRKQLVLGAKPMIKVDRSVSEKDIASLELKAKVIPLIIIRTLPNGDIEHWKMDELDIIN